MNVPIPLISIEKASCLGTSTCRAVSPSIRGETGSMVQTGEGGHPWGLCSSVPFWVCPNCIP